MISKCKYALYKLVNYYYYYYTIISNKLWDLSLYFRDLNNRWVLTSQQKALGPYECTRFQAMQTYRNYSFSYLLTFVSVWESFSRKKHFLKNSWFFSFNFIQGHNWLTNYPNSEFHGHWKTVTLSFISPNVSKHWRFLAFWLSLCFGSFLLFLVCHNTAFLFSMRAMTALGWLPNAHRDVIILVRWVKRSRDINNIFRSHAIYCFIRKK